MPAGSIYASYVWTDTGASVRITFPFSFQKLISSHLQDYYYSAKQAA